MTLVDAAGRSHAPAPEARIASLVPSLTELLFDLGLGSQVVGRTSFCIHPGTGVEAVARIGGTKTVNFERLAKQRPTHVLVNIDENLKDDVPKLEALGAEVIVTHPMSPEDNAPLFQLLGGIFCRTAAADQLGEALASELEATRTAGRDAQPRDVLYLIWRDPWMCVSRDTYIARMLALIGWHTVPADSGLRYPTVEPGASVWREADRVLLSSEPYPFKERHIEEIRAQIGDNAAPIEFIDGEMMSWYGSRAIDGLRYLRTLR